MEREPVVLEPHAWVGVPVVSWHVGRSTKGRTELRVADALTKGRWTSLVRRPAAVAVVVAVVSPPASTVVVVARAIVTVIVDALGPPSGLDGVVGGIRNQAFRRPKRVIILVSQA
jgi:hypothetical protein